MVHKNLNNMAMKTDKKIKFKLSSTSENRALIMPDKDCDWKEFLEYNTDKILKEQKEELVKKLRGMMQKPGDYSLSDGIRVGSNQYNDALYDVLELLNDSK